NYFCSLKNKLNKYGDFFITAPRKSDLLQTNLDYYDSSYTCLASSFSIFLNSNYYVHTPNNPLSLFITNNVFQNYNSNYKFYNNVRHVICKYNSSKHYCTGFNKKNSLTDNLKYQYLEMHKSALPLLLRKGIDIIDIDNEYYTVRCKNRNRDLLNKIYTEYVMKIFDPEVEFNKTDYIDVLDINVDIDTFGRALKIFLLDNTGPSFSNIIYMLLNG